MQGPRNNLDEIKRRNLSNESTSSREADKPKVASVRSQAQISHIMNF